MISKYVSFPLNEREFSNIILSGVPWNVIEVSVRVKEPDSGEIVTVAPVKSPNEVLPNKLMVAAIVLPLILYVEPHFWALIITLHLASVSNKKTIK